MLENTLEKMIEWRLARAQLPPIPLTIQFPSRKTIALGKDSKVTLRINRWDAWRVFLFPTLIRMGEAYIQGELDVEGDIADITDCVMQLSHAVYPAAQQGKRLGFGWLARLLRHTRRGDKRAIQYHYDVSNEFYRLFLDERMVYSCAYFKQPTDTLDQAQLNKLDHILNKLQVKPGEHFLDVGCGWGGLVIRAAQRGAHAIGITLSQQQYDHCQMLIKQYGLQQQCEVRIQDYREIDEPKQYDKIASVGMFEHVGLARLEKYFRKMHSLLKDNGAMLMHGITSSSVQNREVGRGAGKFIDRYVFPDGELPHISYVISAMSAVGLEVYDVESLRRHYAITLDQWSRRLDSYANRAVELAGDQRYRIWRAYLAGCSYGFAHRWMNIYQLLACKADQPDTNNPFPMTRAPFYPCDH